jgi:hypothetical protein
MCRRPTLRTKQAPREAVGSSGRQTCSWEPTPSLPLKIARSDLLIPFLQAIFTSDEQKRLGVSIGHYHAALRDWTTAGQPLALMHLYPALEALGGAVERAERTRLGLADKAAHALHRRIDVTKTNWREVLLGWVRRDAICKGDQPTYKAAYEASNGLEHGSLDMPSIHAVARQVTPKLFGYAREGVLDLLDLDADVRERLGKLRVLDVTPLHMEMRGVLTGTWQMPTCSVSRATRTRGWTRSSLSTSSRTNRMAGSPSRRA